jgi:hypothetical protein
MNNGNGYFKEFSYKFWRMRDIGNYGGVGELNRDGSVKVLVQKIFDFGGNFGLVPVYSELQSGAENLLKS